MKADSIAPYATYELVKQDITTKPLGTAAQLALQGVINSFENAVSAESINKDGIIYTAAITTQSTAPVFAAVKSLLGAKLQAASATSTPLLTLANSGETAIASVPANAHLVFKLRWFTKAVSNCRTQLQFLPLQYPVLLNQSWKARCDSGAIIATLTDAEKLLRLKSLILSKRLTLSGRCL